MPDILDPRKFANVVKQGFVRGRHYRKARAMFIKAYCGHYYAKKYGLVGDEPINLMFHTIRALIPNLIMQNPVNEVSTQLIPYRDYAFLLGLALDRIDKKLNLKEILRYGTVDACFGFAPFKTGLSQGGTMINYGDVLIDNGQVYTDNVDIDDFVFDPTCRKISKSAFLGDRNRLPRQILLDDDSFEHDLVMKLPRSGHPDVSRRVDALTQSGMSSSEINDLQDMVDVVELFVPGADALLTIADPEQIIMDDFLAAREYYGPSEGPYTILSVTQPVPGNPYPIAPAGIWYDLHHAAGGTMRKMVEQIQRQKDIAVVDPAGADEAEDIRTSVDGDMVFGQPDTVKVVSFGGQNPGNESAMGALQTWYNYMSGNPDQMAGIAVGAKTATGQNILQANQNVSIEDMRGMIYDCSAKINQKMAWYLHTDPYIELPFSRRLPGGEHEQLILTPEQRQGEFLDYAFNIRQRSMSRLDPAVRSKRIMEFATNVIPGLAMTAQVCMQMGLPFNLQESVTDIANEMDILEDVQDWFNDPMFLQRMEMMMAMGPQPTGKASPASPKGVQQNGGNPMAHKFLGPQGEMNQGFQQGGAAEAQSTFQGVN